MNFFKNTPVEEWTRVNILNYYREELYDQKVLTLQQTSKVLDYIKKDLQKVTAASDSEFDSIRKSKAQTIMNNWSNWSAPIKMNKKRLNANEIFKKIEVIRANQQLRAITNSVEQVDLFQKQFTENTRKRNLDTNHEEAQTKKIKTSALPSIDVVKSWNTENLIEFLQEQDLYLNKKHFDILRSQEITGYSFLTFTKEEFQECGLAVGSSKALVSLIDDLHHKAIKSSDIEINREKGKLYIHDEILKKLREELSEELREGLRDLREDLFEDLCDRLDKRE